MANYINNNNYNNFGVAHDHALRADTAESQAILSQTKTGNSTCLADQPGNPWFSSQELLPQAQPAMQLWGGHFAGPECPLCWTCTCCDFSTLEQQ